MPKVFSDGLPSRATHPKGFRKSIGSNGPDTPPRTFWLGQDRKIALAKMRALELKWAQLEAAGEYWTDEKVKGALALLIQIAPIVVSTPTVITTAPLPVAPLSVTQPTLPPIPAGLTLYQGFQLWLDDQKRRFERREIGDEHYYGCIDGIEKVKEYLPDRPLDQVTTLDLERMVGTFTSRPVLPTTGLPMSINYATRLAMMLGSALRHLDENNIWYGPRNFRNALAITFAAPSSSELKAARKPKPCFTLEELKVIARTASPLQWRYMLVALFLGWTQKEMSVALKEDVVEENGDTFLWRFRHKTQVEGKWWCCPELAQVLRWNVANTTDNNLGEEKKALLFLSELGKQAEPQTYADILAIVTKPVDERGTLAIGRNGEKVAPRRFHLTPEKVEALRQEWKDTKAVPNPQNAGAYHEFIEALKTLGVNKPHTFQTVKAQMRKAMGSAETKDDNGETAWQRFAGKEAATENEENALDIDGRIHQNAEVLQRLGGFTPYGLKLLQVGTLVMKTKGCVIDILKGSKGEKCYRLNTNAAEPTNEFRKRRGN